MTSAQNLILEVFKQDDALKMGLFNQGQTAPTLRHYSQVGVSFNELKHLSAEMVAVLNRKAREQSEKDDQLKSLEKVGRLFWDHLLSRPIKEKLKNSQHLILTLILDEELIHIPWELIFDGSDFLCLKFSLGRLVRSKGDPASLQYRDLSDSLKMLILANPNDDLRSAYAEGLSIKNQFSNKHRKVQVNFKSTYIDKHYVKKNICDYDIVHFAGHCEFDKNNAQGSGWVLSDGVFNLDDILKMGSSCSLPALVFSNACHSAQVNPHLIDTEYQKANYGMACAFLFAGVRHYIGSIRKIEDSSSLVFAKEFYTLLISGISVGEALRLSKLRLIKEYGLSSLHWVNYLLYGEPSFIFFKAVSRKYLPPKISLIHKKIILRLILAAIFTGLSVFLLFWLPKINPTKLYLYLKAESAQRQGNNHQAITLGQQIIGRDRQYLPIYPILANAYLQAGEKETAKKYYFDYLIKSEKLNSRPHLIQAYIKLGWFYQFDGQYDKAKELYDKALDLSHKSGDRQNEALALRKLAVWHIDKSDYDRALDLLTKSAAINLENPDNFESTRNLASDYFDIGLVFANKNDFVAAKDFYAKSLKIFQKLKLTSELSDCYFNLGEICLFQKQYQQALDYYQQGLKLDQQHNNQVNLACGYNMIGELYLEMEDFEKAENFFNRAAGLAGRINNLPESGNANYNLGLLYKMKGSKNRAKDYWRQAQEVFRRIDPERYQDIRNELLELDAV